MTQRLIMGILLIILTFTSMISLGDKSNARNSWEAPQGYMLKEVQEYFESDGLLLTYAGSLFVEIPNMNISISTDNNSFLEIFYWMQIGVDPEEQLELRIYLDQSWLGTPQIDTTSTFQYLPGTYQYASMTSFTAPSNGSHQINIYYRTGDGDRVNVWRRHLVVKEFIPVQINMEESDTLKAKSVNWSFLFSWMTILSFLAIRRFKQGAN
ncbi:MAG: hypothetical protein ACFFDT_08760 [Candidatus Hodarchaeota archaeon]